MINHNELKDEIVKLAAKYNCEFGLLLYSETEVVFTGSGCIACAVESYNEWLFKALNDNKIKHNVIEDKLMMN